MTTQRPTVQIIVHRSTLRVAPEGMNFELVLSGFDTNTLPDPTVYDPSYHDKIVVWDFGDGDTYRAPETVAPEYMNSRYGFGPLGSHTYRTPGHYTVRVTVIEPDSGKTAYGVFHIGGPEADTDPVRNPDGLFAGSDTYFVDATGGQAPAPKGAQVFPSLEAAFAKMVRAKTPGRIVLARGQTHLVRKGMDFRVTAAGPRTLRIEAQQGPGARPRVRLHPTFTSPTHTLFMDQSIRNDPADKDVVFSGVDFFGTFDAATETYDVLTVFYRALGHCARYLIVDDCLIDGWSLGLHMSGTGKMDTCVVNDTVVTNWQNMGISDSSRGFSAFTGCGLRQHVHARSGGDRNTQPARNVHGPMRVHSSHKVLVHSCDMFSRTGWSWVGSFRAVQPCLRFHTEESPGARLNCHGNAMEGGWAVIMLNLANTGMRPHPHNAVIDGNILVGLYQSRMIIYNTFSGTTVRNNVMVHVDAERDFRRLGEKSHGTPASFVWLDSQFSGPGGRADPANAHAPIRVYNNTCVNLLSDRNQYKTENDPAVMSDIHGHFTDALERNNIRHQPNRQKADTPFAPLKAVRAFVARYNGYRYSDTGQHLPQTATPPNSAAFWLPELGSAALGAALTEPSAMRDNKGRMRPDPPSIGAFEAPE